MNTTPVAATTFTDATAATGTYYYVVRAVLSDGTESPSSNELQVVLSSTIGGTNAAPTVNAGVDRTITLPATVTLNATATDDGLPSGTLRYNWTVVSGSGATLATPASAGTSASFSAAGVYTFRVTVTDGSLSASDDVIVTVNPAPATLVAPANLASACNSSADAFSVGWSPVAGADYYYLRVDNTANNSGSEWFITDGVDYNVDAYTGTTFSGSATPGQSYSWWVHAATAAGVIGPAGSGSFICNASTPNAAPMVDAGADQTVTLPSTATLTGSATDDGKPSAALTYSWSVVGTGATLSSPNSLSTTATFSAAGTYTLRLTVSDGALSSSDDVVVTVKTATLTAPTGLLSQCSADAKSVTIKWDPVTGAASYYVRVDYLANNTSAGWYVDGNDYMRDGYTDTTFTASTVPGQQYNAWIHTANAAGDLSTAAWISFTCNPTGDVIAPTVSITSPVNGTTMNGATLTVAANAADNVGVAGVQFKLNGVNFGAEDLVAPYSVSTSIKSWAAGTYVIQAVARDAAGNRTTSASVTVKIGKKGANAMAMPDTTVNAAVDGADSETLNVRYAEMPAGSASDAVALISLENGGDVVSETAVPAAAPVSEGRIYVNVNELKNTGLAMANNDEEPVVISFFFTNKKGEDFGHGLFTLDAKSNIATFVNQEPFGLPMFMEGTLTFASSKPVAVTALESLTNDRSEFLMTTLPIGTVGTASVKSMVLPQVANGGGWSSEVILTNPLDTPMTGTVQMIADGTAATSDAKIDYTIPGRSAVRLETPNASADVRTGYVMVSPSGSGAAPQALAMFSFAAGTTTLTQAGVQATSVSTAFHTYVERTANVRPGIAIANSSASPARVTLTLGTMSVSLEIPAGAHVSRFVDELFAGMPETFAGKLLITSSSPVAVTGLRIRTNNQGRTIISGVPVVDDTTIQNGNSGRLFPIVVTGGGYNTTFLGTPKGQN